MATFDSMIDVTYLQLVSMVRAVATEFALNHLLFLWTVSNLMKAEQVSFK